MQNSVNCKENKTKELEKRIIRKSEKLIKNKINELKIINSQIFNIQVEESEIKNKEKIEEEKIIIERILNRINEIKEQIDIYKNNKLIEDAIYIEDKLLMNDILEYKKNIIKEKPLKKEYEKIKDYEKIISEINKTKEKCITIKEEKERQLNILKKEEEELELTEKDINEEELTIEKIKELIEEEVNLLSDYSKKIGIIEEESIIVYNYEVLKKLLSLEMKYIALINLLPLKGTIPHIAIAAKQTKDTIDLLSAGPLITTEEKINYFTNDYTKELENLEYTLNDIDQMINNSKNIITNLKYRIKDNNLINKNEKYTELLSKIEKLEKCINDSSLKISINKSNINKNKNKNAETKEKILKLNKKT